MNKKLLVLVIVVSAALFAAGGIFAKAVPDIIKLEDPAYKEHKKGVVDFTHGKHQSEYAEKYPEFYKNGCGECHHDKEDLPRSSLMEEDDVQTVLDHRLSEISRYRELFRNIEQEGMSDWPEGAKFVLGFGKAVAAAMETYIKENRHALATEPTARTVAG